MVVISRWKPCGPVLGYTEHWAWRRVVAPLLVTRIALLMVGWFSQHLPINLNYPGTTAVARGWDTVPFRLLDIWGRWDTSWYIGIVQRGYVVGGDLQGVQNNLAFFPFYPFLVRALSQLAPEELRTTAVVFVLGVALSNLFLLGALILLYRLVASSCNSEEVAARTVRYVLLFPAGFFFSCFYTESAYLLLSVATFYAASARKWMAAGCIGFFLALTRPTGVLTVIPLAWMYLEECRWKLRSTGLDALWLLLIPAGISVFLLSLHGISESLTAPFQAQHAWGRSFRMPWETLWSPGEVIPYITQVDRVSVTFFSILGICSLKVMNSKGYGIYALLILAPILTSGILNSAVRYCAVIFPAFTALAFYGRHHLVNKAVTISFMAGQALLMAAWCQFYWVA